LNVLKDFHTQTRITLHECDFGSQQDAEEQLLATFQTKRSRTWPFGESTTCKEVKSSEIRFQI
jgi:hypothetical protein